MFHHRLRECLMMGLAICALVGGVRAGVLVTRTLDVHMGDLAENDQGLTLKISEGSLTFSKENLSWYTLDPAVDTFLKAARQAALDNQMDPVVRKLLEVSAQREPSTKAEARKMLKAIEQASREKLARLVLPTHVHEPLNLNPPSLIKHPVTFSSGPPVGISLSLDQVDFQGFVTYNTYAVSNGRLFTFPIQQPVFSKTHINTTVTVDGGQTIRIGGY